MVINDFYLKCAVLKTIACLFCVYAFSTAHSLEKPFCCHKMFKFFVGTKSDHICWDSRSG